MEASVCPDCRPSIWTQNFRDGIVEVSLPRTSKAYWDPTLFVHPEQDIDTTVLYSYDGQGFYIEFLATPADMRGIPCAREVAALLLENGWSVDESTIPRQLEAVDPNAHEFLPREPVHSHCRGTAKHAASVRLAWN